MVREIMRDEAFLAQKAKPATVEDLPVAQDLLDTLEANQERCVGMAANMIGINRRIIVFDNEGTYMVMFNPEIIKRSDPYKVEEGCLSLEGTRPARRWQSIKVRYQNEKFQERFYCIAEKDPAPPLGRYEKYPVKDCALLITAAETRTACRRSARRSFWNGRTSSARISIKKTVSVSI